VFAVGINDHVLWRALHSRLIGTLVTDDFVSCPLGLFTERDGKDQLVPVGGIAAFSNARRLELVEEFDPLVLRDDEGNALDAATDRSRFSSSKDVSFVPVRAERVVEVAFDQMEGQRFRHAVTFVRWRPDREPASCRLDQVDRAPAYDLAEVLATP